MIISFVRFELGYFYLFIAIIGEVVGTTYLKSTNNFSELIPSIFVVLGYGTAFYFMMLAMKQSLLQSPIQYGRLLVSLQSQS
jgi:multidrug transporter EmrE-like cation transporter